MSSSVGNYEVFLSFRGSDTRQGLTDVLYEHMDNAKIRVFRDDNSLQIGDKIDSIFEAIVNSKICIPVFSPNFAQSRYCLLEVTKMVELKKTIVPNFCGVTTDDVKLKTPLYVNDFKKLEEKYKKQEVDKWKEALREVVTYKGRKVGDKGYSQFCKEFVVEVLSKLRPRDLRSSTSSSSHQEAVSVGIDEMPRAVATVIALNRTLLGQEFVVSYPIELIFRKDKVLKNYPPDSKGTIISKRKYISFLITIELFNDSGKTLVTMNQKMHRLCLDMHVFRGKSTNMKDLLFKMKFTDGLVYQKIEGAIFKSYVYLAQNTNENVWDYMLELCWSRKTCVVYAGNTNNIVAQIMPNKGTVQTAMIEIDHLVVTVYPGIDYAFIVALLKSANIDFWLKS